MIRALSMISISLVVAEVWLWPRIWSILVTIPGVLEKECVLCCCCGVFYYTVTPRWLIMLFRSSVSLLILCLIVLSVACGEWTLWSSQIQLWICLFPFQVYCVWFKYFEAGLFVADTTGTLICPWWADSFIIMCCVYLSLVIVFFYFALEPTLFWY